jgi:hypothetical protein
VIRDRYARSQQSLTDMMAFFNNCISSLASHGQRFPGIKSYHELYSSVTAAASQLFERERVVSRRLVTLDQNKKISTHPVFRAITTPYLLRRSSLTVALSPIYHYAK